MNPAPPVTSTRRVIALPIVGSSLPASFVGVLGRGAGVRRLIRRGAAGWLVEGEEKARGLDDTEPLVVGGRGAQSDRRRVQELVHEAARQVLDGLSIGC